MTIKIIFKVTFSCVRNDIAKTSRPIKNHDYNCTAPRETVICDSDGMTGDRILH
jgi:hypothetical protein